MKVGIVGAGITGLTAAYELSKREHQVVILEKENYAGGLAAGFKKEGWDWSLENFFHHFFTSDYALQNLTAELGLADKLFFRRPKSSVYYNGEINQLDSPLSVLKFPHLSLSDRLRTGLITAYLKSTNNWGALEKTTAKEWLTKFYGHKAYQVLWQPLLRAKFGDEAEKVSMVWFWARIKKRSASLGYIEGGFQVLVDKLVEKIKANGGEIRLGSEVKEFDYLNDRMRTDRAIFTTPLNSKEFKWVGALNLILELKEPFLTDGTYWLNINEPDFPFVAVVEHTNFIDKRHYGGNHILYVGGYYPWEHKYFQMSKEEIFQEFLPFLQKINPDYDYSLVPIAYCLFTSPFAQPVIPTNYSQITPSFKTSNPRILRANMQMVYPWDRGVNYAIELGKRVAKYVE